MSTPYTYIFVRQDLSVPQQIVQSSHAALEAGFSFDQPASTSHIVLFGAENEDQLTKTAAYLERHGIEHTMFYEPDDSVGYTAIATKPLFGEERKLLRRFRLLKE